MTSRKFRLRGSRVLPALLAVALVEAGPASAQPRLASTNLYRLQSWSAFFDIFPAADGGYALCGSAYYLWLARVDHGGSLVLSRVHDVENYFSLGSSVIITNRGKYLVGGRNARQFTVALFNADGSLEWLNHYGRVFRQAHCTAVLETKSGEFVVAGYGENEGGWNRGFALMLEPDGDPIWEIMVGEGDAHYEFVGAREHAVGQTGIVLAGNIVSFGRSDPWAYFVDLNGVRIKEWTQWTEPRETVSGITSTTDYKYALAGDLREADGTSKFFLTVLDYDLNHEFTQSYEIWPGPGRANNCRGVVTMPDNGFLLYGYKDANPGPFTAIRLRTSSSGDLRYVAKDNYGGAFAQYHSAVVTRTGEVVLCGVMSSPDRPDESVAFISKAFAEQNPPTVASKNPPEDNFKVLVGDRVRFSVKVEDPDRGDTFTFLWRHNGAQVGQDSVCVIDFPDMGRDSVTVTISDSLHVIRTGWAVEVTDFYISEWTPHELDLFVQRADTVTFSMTVRSLDNAVPNYQWIVNGVTVSDEPTFQHTSDIPGEYLIEGVAYRGQQFDEVIWLVTVQSMIGRWRPYNLNLTLPVDTTVTFLAAPTDPSRMNFTCLWTLNRRRVTRDTTATITFNELGHFELIAAANIGWNIDRVIWQIDVVAPPPPPPPDTTAVFDRDPEALTYALSAPHPNPFNAAARLTYSVPRAGHARLVLTDLSGRAVQTLVDGFIPPGRRTLTLDAARLPAGVYLLRFQAGDFAHTERAVIVK